MSERGRDLACGVAPQRRVSAISALILLSGTAGGCDGDDAPPAPAPVVTAVERPAPEAPSPPVERTQRFVDDPWPAIVDGFDIHHHYEDAELDESCRAAHGIAGPRSVGGRRCDLGRGPTRTIEYSTDLYQGERFCNWDVRERVPVARATDARLAPVFGELLTFERALTEHGVPPDEHAREPHPHIRTDRDYDDVCWPRLVAGDFGCVREGQVQLRLESVTGIVRYREVEGQPETREVIEDTTEAIRLDLHRDVTEPMVLIGRSRMVHCGR